MDTLLRDLRGVASKIRHIILPTSSATAYKNVIKDWDLWGPLIMCTFMGLTLHHDSDGQLGPHFAQIFALIWLGSLMVSTNYRLLALAPQRKSAQPAKSLIASPSVFQLICVLGERCVPDVNRVLNDLLRAGYCLALPCAGIIILKVVSAIFTLEMRSLLYEKLFVGTIMGFVWPTISAVKILSRYLDYDKRPLAIYPIALFFFVISWFIISVH